MIYIVFRKAFAMEFLLFDVRMTLEISKWEIRRDKLLGMANYNINIDFNFNLSVMNVLFFA